MPSNEHVSGAPAYTMHGADLDPHSDLSFQRPDSPFLGDKMATFPDFGGVGYPSLPPWDEDFEHEPSSRPLTDPKQQPPLVNREGTDTRQLVDAGSNVSRTPLDVWHASTPSPESESPLGPTQPPPSTQNEIVSRRESAGHRFGQVTPPEESSEDKAMASSTKRPPSQSQEAAAQRLRQERARNAAHSRHSRNHASQMARTFDVEGNTVVEEEDGEGDGKREKYREKNRLAAAKCRSKKKASVTDLEGRHRVMAAENNFRRREERELRDELTTLRTLALEHGLGRCSCGGLHQYNHAKAAEMALGHRFGAPGLIVLTSPVEDGPSPVTSLSFDPSDRRLSEHHDSMEKPASPASMLEQFSAAHQANQTMHDQVMSMSGSIDDYPDFAEFLQSSPGGRQGPHD